MNPKSSCGGCRGGSPNQHAHMDTGGCLSTENEDFDISPALCISCGDIIYTEPKFCCTTCLETIQNVKASEAREKEKVYLKNRKALREYTDRLQQDADEEDAMCEEDARCEEGRRQMLEEEFAQEKIMMELCNDSDSDELF